MQTCGYLMDGGNLQVGKPLARHTAGGRAEHLKIGGKIWAGGGGSTWLLNLDGCYECPLHGWQICDIGYPFNGRQICHDYMGVMNLWAAYI